MIKPTKIYVFCNTNGGDWLHGYAIGEDGRCVASHTSSTVGYVKTDMGVTEPPTAIGAQKRELYADAYPSGYEIVWIPVEEVKTHPGLEAAYQKNQERARAAKAVKEPQ